MSPRFPRKEVTALAREAVRRGWRAERTGRGHLRLISPSGKQVTCSSTPRVNGIKSQTMKDLEGTGEW